MFQQRSGRLLVVCIISFVLGLSSTSLVSAQEWPNKQYRGFFNLSDVVNSNELLTSTEHSIQFTLPTNSRPILPTDYIQIYLAEFTDVTAPSQVRGYYSGTPQFSVSGKYARVTGIHVNPGAYIEINGIGATSPDSEDKFQVIVMVTTDEAGLTVLNYGNTIATVNRGVVNVSANIPLEQAGLSISGYTSPGTFLIFSDDQAVIGTDTADGTGYFLKNFYGLQPTTHNITFYGIDTGDRVTSTIPISIYTPVNLQTSISNQLLSTTLGLSTRQITSNEDIIASGSAYPGSQISLFTEAPLRSYIASAAADGSWAYTISDTENYITGDYRVFAIAQTNGGLQSLTSPSIIFRKSSTTSVAAACGDISQADLNCDGNVDLTDFSILMYYWATVNEAADINSDLIVNITDFSILMYYWGS